MPLTLELVQGASRDFPLQISNPDGTPATNFLNTDTLTASVWTGANETTILTPSTTWLNGNAPAGQIQITFQNADSAGLAFGIYFIQAFATRAGSPPRTAAMLPRGSTLEILAASGSMAQRPTYITITDLRTIAPWVDDIQAPDNHTGFDEQCADARDWLDEITLRNYRGGNVSLLGYHGFALDAWYTGGGPPDQSGQPLAEGRAGGEPPAGDAPSQADLQLLRPVADLREPDHQGQPVRHPGRPVPVRGRKPAGFDHDRDRR